MNKSESFPPEEAPQPSRQVALPNAMEAKSHPGLVARYSLFRDRLDPKADVVYHPCGANDVSPSTVFPNSRVIYVDNDPGSVEALKRGGFEIHAASALEFDPGNVDVLIMLNPEISPNIPSSHVVKGGFAISNNYHGTASALHQNDQYQLQAIIRASQNGELIFDTENLEDCWKEIETEEEFKNAPSTWGVVNYATAAKIVEIITGKKENILVEYKKIVEATRETEKQKRTKMIEEQPELASLLGDPDKEDIFMLNHEGRQYALPVRLPRKKGTVDDIFIFQKIQ